MTWTLETIKAVIDERDLRYAQRFAAQESALASALASQKEAILKAEHATEKRFDSVNEFRGQLKDQTATFVSRSELESEVKFLKEKLEQVNKRLDVSDGRSGGSASTWQLIAAGFGIVAVLMGMYTFFIGAKSTPQPVIGVEPPPVHVAPTP